MGKEKIFVTKPSMPAYKEYIEAIKPLWDSCQLTNMGKYHQELELKLTKYLAVPKLSLMVNGHMALELTIQAFNFPEGAEIITTPFTFVSTTHAIIRNRLKPVFCDVKLCDGTIDETKIERLITKETVAILPVHVYGNICNVKEIQKIADKHNLKVIYDAAHAFGVKYEGKGIGSYGDASIFSFHATKVFNTIEGGAVAFSNLKLGEKLYNLKNFGIRNEESVIDIGANAKMNEFTAIMGLCNLNHIDSALEKRKKCYMIYDRKLKLTNGVSLLSSNLQATKNYAYLPVLIHKNYKMSRDQLYNFLKSYDIYPRKYFYPLTSDQNCFKKRYQNIPLKNARFLAEHILTLPLYEDLEKEKIEWICSLLK